MSGEIFDFEWFVHEAGYEWIDTGYVPVSAGQEPSEAGGEYEQSWISVAGEPSSRSLADRRRYFPLRDCSCLFRTFAETPATREGIKGFADSFGLLGVERDTIQGRSRPYIGTAEPVSAWMRELEAVSRALLLWDLVRCGDLKSLRNLLQPLTDHAELDSIPSLNPRPAAGERRWFRIHPWVAELAGDDRYDLIALNRVQAIINERVSARVSPRILWDSPEREGWGLYFVPDNLAGAIWIQFAQAITENRDYRRCRQCDSWFEIDHYKARSNRYYCSNACRSKAYRDRQRRACDLADTGVGLNEIAERLDSDAETVARWVGRG